MIGSKDALESTLACAREHWLYKGDTGRSELRSWPYLTRDVLRQRIGDHANQPHYLRSAYLSPTSGTSGQSLLIASGIEENHQQRRQIGQCLKSCGMMSANTVMLNLFGVGWMARSAEIVTELAEHCESTVAPYGNWAKDSELERAILDLHPDMLAGTPSRLAQLAASRASEHKGRANIPTVLYAGEFLQPGERRLLTSQLGVRNFHSIYGSAEIGIVGFHCHREGSLEPPQYRIPKDVAIVEVVDQSDDGTGELVVTNVVRRRTPIVRYLTGDRARFVSDDDASSVIELVERESERFAIGERTIRAKALDDIITDVLRIQICIDDSNGKARLTVLLAYPTKIGEGVKHRNEMTIRNALATFDCEIAIVANGDFCRVGPHNKIPKVIDRRKVNS